MGITALLAVNIGELFSWTSILLHMLNLVILVGGLWLLLYKPVKKMIQRRKDTLQNQVDENAKGKAEVDELKTKYDGLIQDVEKKGAQISEEARIAAEEQKKHILEESSKQAKEMLTLATHEIEQEKQRAQTEMKQQVAALSTDIAAKIIEREIKQEDNDKLIERCLEEWENDEEH